MFFLHYFATAQHRHFHHSIATGFPKWGMMTAVSHCGIIGLIRYCHEFILETVALYFLCINVRNPFIWRYLRHREGIIEVPLTEYRLITRKHEALIATQLRCSHLHSQYSLCWWSIKFLLLFSSIYALCESRSIEI